jgi:hypothetical protein
MLCAGQRFILVHLNPLYRYKIMNVAPASLSFFSKLFLLASLWNLAGAMLGFFNTAFTYQLIFNKELTDPLMFAVYQGAWGTTLTYFIGYLIVSRNPERHFGVVVTGGIGKLGFIVTLLKLYFAGIAGPEIFVIVIGDGIFLVLFGYYFYRLYQSRNQRLEQQAVEV